MDTPSRVVQDLKLASLAVSTRRATANGALMTPPGSTSKGSSSSSRRSLHAPWSPVQFLAHICIYSGCYHHTAKYFPVKSNPQNFLQQIVAYVKCGFQLTSNQQICSMSVTSTTKVVAQHVPKYYRFLWCAWSIRAIRMWTRCDSCIQGGSYVALGDSSEHSPV